MDGSCSISTPSRRCNNTVQFLLDHCRKCANKGAEQRGIALKHGNRLPQEPTSCRPVPPLVQLSCWVLTLKSNKMCSNVCWLVFQTGTLNNRHGSVAQVEVLEGLVNIGTTSRAARPRIIEMSNYPGLCIYAVVVATWDQVAASPWTSRRKHKRHKTIDETIARHSRFASDVCLCTDPEFIATSSHAPLILILMLMLILIRILVIVIIVIVIIIAEAEDGRSVRRADAQHFIASHFLGPRRAIGGTSMLAKPPESWQTRAGRTGVCEKCIPPVKNKFPWEDKLSEHQLRGSRAVSADALQDQGSHERSVVFCHRCRQRRVFRARCPPVFLLCLLLRFVPLSYSTGRRAVKARGHTTTQRKNNNDQDKGFEKQSKALWATKQHM